MSQMAAVRKTIPAMLILFLMVLSPGLQAEDASLTKGQVIHQAWTAMFGDLEEKDIATLYVEAFDDGATAPNRYMIKRPNLFRNDFREGVLVFDGNRAAWVKRGPDDEGKPQKPEMIESSAWMHFEVDIALLFPAFFDFPAELRGLSRVGEHPAYELYVALPLGSNVTYFVDATSFLVIKRLVSWEGDPEQYLYDHMITGYSDYGGILYEQGYIYPRRAGPKTRQYKNVRFNKDLAPELFAIPDGLD